MPYKYLTQKGIEIKKHKYKVNNWSKYNNSLINRGNSEIWMDEKVQDNWLFKNREHYGSGSTKHYTNNAIIICFEIMLVFKLPLRQTEGFINSLFKIRGLPKVCPNYTTLSRRLAQLKITCPKNTQSYPQNNDIAAIMIDSTGLKRFGRDEWHQEKHKVSPRRSWRKLHIAVNGNHFIQAATLTERYITDEDVIEEILKQTPDKIEHFTADGAYDKKSVYDKVSAHSPGVEIVIPPAKNATINSNNHKQRNMNINEIALNGRMAWQRNHSYGKRNYSELGIQRYKRILGRAMHSRKLLNQIQEAMIGCGVLNKMTSLGMPDSSKIC